MNNLLPIGILLCIYNLDLSSCVENNANETPIITNNKPLKSLPNADMNDQQMSSTQEITSTSTYDSDDRIVYSRTKTIEPTQARIIFLKMIKTLVPVIVTELMNTLVTEYTEENNTPQTNQPTTTELESVHTILEPLGEALIEYTSSMYLQHLKDNKTNPAKNPEWLLTLLKDAIGRNPSSQIKDICGTAHFDLPNITTEEPIQEFNSTNPVDELQVISHKIVEKLISALDFICRDQNKNLLRILSSRKETADNLISILLSKVIENISKKGPIYRFIFNFILRRVL